MSNTDRIKFITMDKNWTAAGAVIDVRMNVAQNVVQLQFNDGSVAEIHAFDAGGGREALVVSDLVSGDNVKVEGGEE